MKTPGLLLLLLAPFFVEALGVKALIITIPGSPLSLGALCSLGFGIPVLITNKGRSSRIVQSLLIIYLGALVGAFFSDDVLGNISAALGQCFLLIGVYALAIEFSKQNLRLFWMLDAFMFACWLYWFNYIVSKIPLLGAYTSYSALWTMGKVLNHHIPGLLLSVSAIYLANRLIGRSKLASYGIMGLTIVGCIVIDSRSNVLFSTLGLVWMIFQHRKLSVRFVLISLVALYGLFYTTSRLFEDYKFLRRRFDVQNQEYQSATVQSRIYFYERFLVELARLPLGRGIENTKVEHDYKMMLLHNQFLTFILAGGLIAMVGIIMLFSTFFRILFRYHYRSERAVVSPYIIPIKGFSLVLMATLTTIEFGGSIVYLCFATMSFLEIHYKMQVETEKKRAKLNARSAAVSE
jgi:hypothetical protein